MTEDELNNLNKNNEEEMQEVEVETLEFSLNDEEIEELISKLQSLKETKTFTFEIDDENELQLNYEEASKDEENEEEQVKE
ncbi:MAG: hypothetical protein ACOCUU_01410 [Nanoarchaeota archaeon]